ncbi:MAG TPA: MBL fold metallo-hydrolase [Candidatus Eisenbacteria bacterium]|nr:MBL fold metallo-hydrolase [Candidatus Eisenbacteria bacterium]
MDITLVRHATLLLELDGRRLLVDPQLDDQGARPPIDNTPNPRRNPLVPLPVPAEDVVRGLDAVVVTHLHRDHLDETAERLLPRDVPVFCQPQDEERLRSLGLVARPVGDVVEWDGLRVARTGGRHGTGRIAELLAPVSGFVLGDLYVAGDTVWCPEVADAIERHRPAAAVVNAGGARFLEGDPIVMTAADVLEVAARVPAVVAVHMEAINHCLLTRAELRAAAPGVLVPADGETISL